MKLLFMVLFVDVSFQCSFKGMGGLHVTNVRRESVGHAVALFPLLQTFVTTVAIVLSQDRHENRTACNPQGLVSVSPTT